MGYCTHLQDGAAARMGASAMDCLTTMYHLLPDSPVGLLDLNAIENREETHHGFPAGDEIGFDRPCHCCMRLH